MILACASSFSCNPPRGPLLFRAIGSSSCRFIACKRFFLSCPFARTIFARSHYHSYTRAPALFRKFHSANSRTRWSVFFCFHLLYHCYANRGVQRYFAARYIYRCAVIVLFLDGAYIICNYTACKTILVIPLARYWCITVLCSTARA